MAMTNRPFLRSTSIRIQRYAKAALSLLPLLGGGFGLLADDALPAYPPLPSERQLQWHALEFYGFLHFTVNTFTDKEWGYGDESPATFNPTDFDADQIVGVAKAGGMKGLILTAKHHDGFCLWPSKFTEHSVKNSPWKNGKGDVVREIADACRKHGLKFGVYLSPWDRNYKDYGRPEYITYYRNQLRELLTNYGPIFEVWFDGANGGDGFYGGAKEKRTIDRRTYYDWPATWQLVRELQPLACMFSDGGPDVRWVGNESGTAGETCWATLKGADFAPGEADTKRLNRGDRPGTHWLPAECDVSIRPGWFYHASEDSKVKTPRQLLDLYFASVGRGGAFLLNLPPDRRGRIHENDARSLQEFRQLWEKLFKANLARDARLETGGAPTHAKPYDPRRLLDDDPNTYWVADEKTTSPEFTLDFKQPVTFDVVELREYLALGQRIEAVAVDAWRDGQWADVATATSIGNRRLIRTAPVTTPKVRLRIVRSAAPPVLSEFALRRMP
jgi:alpha-L-fucosidase